MVNHQQIYKPGFAGGIVNTTICGRVNNHQSDGYNVSDEVSCKFCLRIIEKGVSVRLKWIGWKPGDKI